MIKKLYALLTENCNLSCPYCDIKSQKEVFNEDKFIQELENFDGDIILFGGEPTLYTDRLFKVFFHNVDVNKKIVSITTNLMKLDDYTLVILRYIPYIGSSWSPSRFNDKEYQIWLNNIDKLHKYLPEKKLKILSTLTGDLLAMDPKEVVNIISKWNNDIIREIVFEYYVGKESDDEYFKRCDEWLCGIYKEWNLDIYLGNIDSVKNFYNDCTDVYSLFPDGTLKKGCPHHMNAQIVEKCYTCDRSEICRPCQLQRYCSFPKNFYQLASKDTNK